MFLIQNAWAQAAPAAQQQASTTTSLILLVVVFVVMYFLMIAPQKKRMKQHQQLISELKRGDEIITQGGLMGRIVTVHEHSVEVELAAGTVVAVQRQYVVQVLPKGSVPKISAAASNKRGGKKTMAESLFDDEDESADREDRNDAAEANTANDDDANNEKK